MIAVSPNINVHFSLIKLNSSSHLCQNNLSSFSLILKMFWMVTRVTDERTFPVLFWVCGLNAVPPVWCKCVHQGRFVLRESHVWKQEDTQQPQFQLEFTIWKQSLMFLCGKTLSETRVPPSSRDKRPLFCEAWFTFSPSFSFYNIPSGRPRIFCVIRKKKDIVSGKLKVTTDPTAVTLTTLLDIVSVGQYDWFLSYWQKISLKGHWLTKS